MGRATLDGKARKDHYLLGEGCPLAQMWRWEPASPTQNHRENEPAEGQQVLSSSIKWGRAWGCQEKIGVKQRAASTGLPASFSPRLKSLAQDSQWDSYGGIYQKFMLSQPYSSCRARLWKAISRVYLNREQVCSSNWTKKALKYQ